MKYNYFHVWGFVRILRGEVNVQDENTIFVDCVHRTHNDCNPLVKVIIFEIGTEIQN